MEKDNKDPTDCPVCGSFKIEFQEYCDECEEWRKNAKNKRKTEARIKKFGSIF